MVQFLDKKEEQGTEQSSMKTGDKENSGVIFLADSHQPKDIYYQVDTTVRDMSKKFSAEPYVSNAYKSVMQSLPILDHLTKSQIANGDTTNLREVYLNPSADYINQRLFNYPRAIAERAGRSFPQSQTLPGQILQKSAGIAGAVQAFDVGRKVAGAAVPFKALAGKTALKSAGRGALAGAAQGFLYAPEKLLDIETRIQQAAMGTVVGAIVSPVTDKVANFVKKKALRKRTTLKGRVERRRADADFKKTVENIREDKVVDDATGLLKENQRELQDIVAIQQVQGKIPKTKAAFNQWAENLSKVYGSTVDDISREIGNVDASLAVNHFDDLISDITSDPGLASTVAAKRVAGFVKAIKKKKNLDFKTLNSLKKDILKRKYRGDVDDVVYTRFRQAFGEFTETIDTTGRMAKLNETMAPQLNFKHKFLTRIKAHDKYETKGLEGLLRKYANRNSNPKGISAGERELMDDAIKYVGKYGIKADDVEAIYGSAGKSANVAKKVALAADETSAARKLESATKRKIRIKQDASLSEIRNTEVGRIMYQAFNTAIRLTLAGYVLNGFHALKGNMGASSGGSSEGVKVD